MAIGLDFSMVKKSGLFLVPVTDDHVKYADLFRALIEVAQARPKPSSHEHERKMMFAGQVSHRLREAGMLISFALAGYFLVAMFSYDALDPSWSHSGSNTEIARGRTAAAIPKSPTLAAPRARGWPICCFTCSAFSPSCCRSC
jgi:hypothetical protein